MGYFINLQGKNKANEILFFLQSFHWYCICEIAASFVFMVMYLVTIVEKLNCSLSTSVLSVEWDKHKFLFILFDFFEFRFFCVSVDTW